MDKRLIQLNEKAHNQARASNSYLLNSKHKLMRLLDLSINEISKEIPRIFDELNIALSHGYNTTQALHEQLKHIQESYVSLYLDNKQVELDFDEIEQMIEAYRSKPHEESQYKKIPIKYYESFKKFFKGTPHRFKCRGKSIPEIGFKREPSHIPKMYATTFAIYLKGDKNVK